MGKRKKPAPVPELTPEEIDDLDAARTEIHRLRRQVQELVRQVDRLNHQLRDLSTVSAAVAKAAALPTSVDPGRGVVSWGLVVALHEALQRIYPNWRVPRRDRIER